MANKVKTSDLLAQVRAIQNAYPQIYLACHVDHVRRRDSRTALSSADASVLSHLSFDPATTTGALAHHLGIAASSLSARIKYLVGAGYVARIPAADRRVIRLKLTHKGLEASSAASVLDTARVTALLGRLNAEERERAVSGIALLATAAARTIRRA